MATYGEDFADEHRFQIPRGCHWQDVRETSANLGTALQNAMRGIETANQQHLYGVFGDAAWSNKEGLPDALLKDLVEHFSAMNIGNQRVNRDVIGDAYEYLIKKFADTTNKKAGEFYTPRSVVQLMVEILDPLEGDSVYDPTCGTAGILLAVIVYVLHGIDDFAIVQGDTLRQPGFSDPATGGLATHDCVLANPPFSLEQWRREVWESDPWGRAFAGLPTDSSSDFAFVQHMVKSMTP